MDREALQRLMSAAGKQGGHAGKGLAAAAIVGGLGYSAYNSIFNVDRGERAIIYNRFGKGRGSSLPSWIPDKGIDQRTDMGEGWHIAIPWFQRPIIYNIKKRAWEARTVTGSMDLQMVDISVRVLTGPKTTLLSERERKRMGVDYETDYASPDHPDLNGLIPTIDPNTGLEKGAELPLLPQIYDELGDDTRMINQVLPSIVPEILKEVIAQRNATFLVNNRNQVSQDVTKLLKAAAAKFHLEIYDVSLTQISFGKEYERAVEQKQVAIQEAERAKNIVDMAKQEAKSIVVAAQGQAESAHLLNAAMEDNPAYLELRRIETAREVAEIISKSANRVYMPADNLLLGLGAEATTNLDDAKDDPKKK